MSALRLVNSHTPVGFYLDRVFQAVAHEPFIRSEVFALYPKWFLFRLRFYKIHPWCFYSAHVHNLEAWSTWIDICAFRARKLPAFDCFLLKNLYLCCQLLYGGGNTCCTVNVMNDVYDVWRRWWWIWEGVYHLCLWVNFLLYLCHTYTFTAVYHHHESLILLASLKNLGVT